MCRKEKDSIEQSALVKTLIAIPEKVQNSSPFVPSNAV